MRTDRVPKALKVKTSFIKLVPHKPEVSGSIPLPATKKVFLFLAFRRNTKQKGKKILKISHIKKYRKIKTFKKVVRTSRTIYVPTFFLFFSYAVLNCKVRAQYVLA